MNATGTMGLMMMTGGGNDGESGNELTRAGAGHIDFFLFVHFVFLFFFFCYKLKCTRNTDDTRNRMISIRALLCVTRLPDMKFRGGAAAVSAGRRQTIRNWVLGAAEKSAVKSGCGRSVANSGRTIA